MGACACCGRSAAGGPVAGWCAACGDCLPSLKRFAPGCPRVVAPAPKPRSIAPAPPKPDRLRARAGAAKKETTPCTTPTPSTASTPSTSGASTPAAVAASAAVASSRPVPAAATASPPTSPPARSTLAKPARRPRTRAERPRCDDCGHPIGDSGEHECGGADVHPPANDFGAYGRGAVGERRTDPVIERHRAAILALRPVKQVDPADELERRRRPRPGPTRLETDKPTPAPMPRAAGNVHQF